MVLLTFIYLSLLIAQLNIQWVSTYNISPVNIDYGYNIAVDVNGNVYVVGFSSNGNNKDIFVRKHNPNGNVLWTRTYNNTTFNSDDEVSDIAVDISGNVYVVGYSSQGAAGKDIWLRKYDTNGTPLWTTTYNYGLGADIGYGITLDASGNIYVAGTVYGGDDFGGDIWIGKFNNNGNLMWYNIYSSTSFDSSDDITIDKQGNIYVLGGTGPDVFIRKYNPAGNELWTKFNLNRPPSYTRTPVGIAVDINDFVYVVEREFYPTQFNLIITKYDSNGNLVSSSTFSSGGVYSNVAVDASGNLYVVGSNNNKIELRKYSTNLNEVWTTTYYTSSNVYGIGFGIAVDRSNNLYVSGAESTPSGQSDQSYIVVIKYLQSVPTGGGGEGNGERNVVVELPGVGGINISIPSDEVASIPISGNNANLTELYNQLGVTPGVILPDRNISARIVVPIRTAGVYTMRVFTLNGEEVFSTTRELDPNSPSRVFFDWLPRDLASGVYIVYVEGGGDVFRGRISILR